MDLEIKENDETEWQLPDPPLSTTCRAQGLPICEPEVVVEPEVEEPIIRPVPHVPARTLLCDCVVKNDESSDDEEVEQLSNSEPPTMDNVLQLEDIRHELQRSQQRVQEIDEQYSLNTPECPEEDPCIDLEIELNQHVVNSEILQLQRNNHKLQQQIKQLQQNCKAADITMHSVRESLCRDLEAGQRLQLRLNQINSFKLQLEHEQTLCAQRYRHLSKDKYDWDDCYEFISKLSDFSEGGHKWLVTRRQYKQEKLLVLDRLNSTKLYLKDLFDFVARVEPQRLAGTQNSTRHSRRFSHRVTQPPTQSKANSLTGSLRLNQSIYGFLKRNEDLFAPSED